MSVVECDVEEWDIEGDGVLCWGGEECCVGGLGGGGEEKEGGGGGWWKW